MNILKGLNKGFFILLITISCNKEINTEKELLIWLDDAEHGFVKKTTANGFSVSMKYLPTEYLAFNEMQKDEKKDEKTFQYYKDQFENSSTFLLILENEDKNTDASNYNVSGLKEYTERIKELSFNIKEAIILKTSSGKTFHPVLTTMENLYEIGNRKVIYMVFSDDNNAVMNSEKIDIIFQDSYLDTGINHFVFESKQINNLPKINFLN